VAGLEPVALTRKIPFEAVMRMALMGGGERIDAAQAMRIGLISERVASEDLMSRAQSIAGIIKQNSPMAMARTKQAIWRSLEAPLEAALDHASALISAHNAGPDFAEGQAAFLERRAPRWSPYHEG
ncbi:MAG: enoyl-CoA hydratase-related protein, partial [Caulobacteraceae bacterium]|nr:enoyl-CoA hydratase-related protein [Caulobacteraceae bacterium]